jgi:hypothetical protein
LTTGSTTLVRRGGDGTSINGTIARDGLRVAFRSGARTLVPGDTNNYWDVFVCEIE